MNIISKKMLFLLFCLTLSLYSSHLFANFSNQSDNTPDTLYAKGMDFFRNNQIDSFYYYFVKANHLYKKNKNWVRYLRTCNGLANYFWNKQQYDSTETYLHKASKTIQTYHIDSSSQNVITTLQILSALYATKGHYTKAEKLLRQTLNKNLKSNKKDFKLPLNTYNTLARLYQRQGDYDSAIEHYQQALSFVTYPLSVQQAKSVGGLHNNIALTYQQKKDYAKALQSFQQYFDILNQQAFSLQEYIVLYNNIGVNYLKMNQCDTALQYIQKAVSLLTSEYDKGYTYHNLGRIKRCLGDNTQALLHLKRALAQKIAVHGKGHPVVAKTYKEIALTYQAKGQLSEALDHHQQAIIILVDGFDQLDTTKNPIIDLSTISSATDLLEVLKAKAVIFSQLQQQQPNKTQYLSTALNTYRSIDTLITQLRQSFKVTGSKYFLTEQSLNTYEQSIQTALHLAQHQSTQQAAYKEQAFHFIQKNKAVVLSEILRDMQAKSFANIPDSLRQKDRDLKIEMAFYRKKIYDGKQDTTTITNSKSKEFENKIFNLNQQQQKLARHIETTYPKYHQLKYDTQTPTVEAIQQQLTENTALIDYFVGDSTIFVATITNQSYKIYGLPKPPNFEQLVSDFRKTLTNRKFIFGDETVIEAANLYINNALQLYKLLLQKSLDNLPERISKLVLIPDGILGHLNFEVLLHHSPKNGKLTDISAYLLHHYQISYAYSSTLWLQAQQGIQPLKQQRFAGFAPIYQEQDFSNNKTTILRGRSSSNIDLPFARQEVTAIADLVKGKKWLNQEATEQKFKAFAPNYDILHLSMHGIFDDRNPLYSSLIFTQDSTQTQEDNYLTVAEIYNMQFKAGLAVLSACNTGYGKLRRGEGIMSLARAFAYSGCPSMVMSLWSVPEKTTATIMVNFYEELRKGATKDAALRSAKLAYLSDEKIKDDVFFSHPYFWAGFVPIGDMSSLTLPQRSLQWWYVIPILLLFVLGYFWWKKS